MPLMSDSLRSLSSALIISALLIAGLVLGKGILIPFTLAVVLAFILSPIVRSLTRVRVPQALAVTLVMIGVLGAAALDSCRAREDKPLHIRRNRE